MGADLIAALAGMLIPPAYDFIKKKFIKTENDTPERTAGTLATTKPEVLPSYIESLAKLYAAQTQFFNRDISGTPSQWITDLRAAIRPMIVILSVVALTSSWALQIPIEEGIRIPLSTYIGAWMTSRLM